MNETLPTMGTTEIKGKPDTGIGVDERGRMTYADAAETGHVEIELPTLIGSPTPTERMHAIDFGPHVIGKIKSSMYRQPYLRSAQPQSPTEVLRHYIGAGQGSGLLDARTVTHLTQVAGDYETSPDPDDYFQKVVRPALLALRPERRQR